MNTGGVRVLAPGPVRLGCTTGMDGSEDRLTATSRTRARELPRPGTRLKVGTQVTTHRITLLSSNPLLSNPNPSNPSPRVPTISNSMSRSRPRVDHSTHNSRTGNTLRATGATPTLIRRHPPNTPTHPHTRTRTNMDNPRLRSTRPCPWLGGYARSPRPPSP